MTSLSSSSRCSLLLIGLSNGMMSFYCLKDMRLVWHYSNPDGEHGPIRNIFIQEPENDPRKTCWVWQCSQHHDIVQLELYSLEFFRRDIYKITADRRRSQYSKLRMVDHRFSLGRRGELKSGSSLELWQSYSPTHWDDWCGSRHGHQHLN